MELWKWEITNYDTILFVLAAHILLFLSIGLDIPFLRQCVGFIYLTFIPGFVLLRAFNFAERGITTLLLSASLSVAFVMFIGLIINTLGPLFGVAAPLLGNTSAIIMTSLTLIIFLFSQRKVIRKSLNMRDRDIVDGLSIRGFTLFALAFLLLLFGAIGALYANTYLIIFAIIGTALVFATCTFSKKILPPKYYVFVLFVVSLGLLYQASLLSGHIMGWDIFREYYTFKLTSTAGYWSPPGAVSYYTVISDLNSLLSTTILPTICSTFLNVDGDFVFKIIYPFIFALVPIFLFKMYESQVGKTVGLLSAFFFIADPINFYGLESLSLAREMIGYLFFAAALYSLLNNDLDAMNRKILFIIFSAALTVSAYSLSFVYAFFLIMTYVVLCLTRNRKRAILDLSLIVVALGIIFAWYMFVSTPPLNNLSTVLGNIMRNFSQDFFSSQARLGGQYALLSPTAQTTLVGLVHKLLIYLTEGFIVVGALVIALKPKSVKLSPEFRLMAMCAAVFLVILLVAPNIAPALNFSRFYRAAMIFLSPLFAVGGLYLLHLFKRIQFPSRIRFTRFMTRGSGLLLLAVILSAFFLFRSGFANYVSGGYPTSDSLKFGYVNKFTNFQEERIVLGNSVPESDVISARWLASKIATSSSIYADELGMATLFDYTSLSLDDTYPLLNTTKPEASSCIYLRGLNIMNRVVSFDLLVSYPQYNISDISPILSQSDKIYSNGQSEAYYAPG